MALREEIENRLDQLRKARASGRSEVSYNGESIKYKTDAEMAAAIADLERQLTSFDRKPVRRILVGTTKGF